MFSLFETRLQKVIVLLGAIIIFFQLSGVSSYEFTTAILQAVGTALLVLVLLVVVRGYHPSHSRVWLFIKRHWKIFVIVCIALIALWGIVYAYSVYQQWKVGQDFHTSQIAYQNCLDKVANLDTWTNTTTTFESIDGTHSLTLSTLKEINPYFNGWENAGSPFYDKTAGHWEWAFMQWMMQNHPDFCSEFNPSMITSFVTQEQATILFQY